MLSQSPLSGSGSRRICLALMGACALLLSLWVLPGSALAQGEVNPTVQHRVVTARTILQNRAATATTATAALQHGPVGQAVLTYSLANKSLTVTTTLSGLAPNSTHPAHIHQGPCSNLNAPVLYKLNNVVADANGQATTSTTIPNIAGGIPASGWSLNVHNGPNLQPADQYTPIVCADISNAKSYATVSSPFAATGGPNENATGSVKLALNSGTLEVSLYVSGLIPNSVHAAHIHAGVCPNAKQVLYNLGPLTANASGVAVKTVSFQNVKAIPANAWAINIHYSNDISTQTGYNPILCGTVVPD